jgi:hypothetical protein
MSPDMITGLGALLILLAGWAIREVMFQASRRRKRDR